MAEPTPCPFCERYIAPYKTSPGTGFLTYEQLASDNARLRTALIAAERHMRDCRRGNTLPEVWAVTEAADALSGTDADFSLANVET